MNQNQRHSDEVQEPGKSSREDRNHNDSHARGSKNEQTTETEGRRGEMSVTAPSGSDKCPHKKGAEGHLTTEEKKVM